MPFFCAFFLSFVTCLVTILEGYDAYKSISMCYNIVVRQGTSLCPTNEALGGRAETHKAERKKMKRKKGYYKGLEREMYLYFTGYSEGGAPSFSKFARQKGLTLAELCSFRKKGIFNEAFEECSEIRRDYLIDSALAKKFDSSFVKYLLDSEDVSAPTEITFKLEVT